MTTFYVFRTQIGQESMAQRCLNNLRSENVKYCQKKLWCYGLIEDEMNFESWNYSHVFLDSENSRDTGA